MRTEINDHAVSVALNSDVIAVAPFMNWNWTTQSLDRYRINLGASWKTPLSNSLTYAENALNPYIRHVVFGDHRYYGLQVIGFDGSVDWFTRKISAQYLIGLNLRYGLDYTLTEGDHLVPPSVINDGPNIDMKHRHRFGLGLNLYL